MKSPYPSTQDPGYEKALRASIADLVSDRDAPVREIVDVDALRSAIDAPQDGPSIDTDRARMESVLQIDAWLRRYRPTLAL